MSTANNSNQISLIFGEPSNNQNGLKAHFNLKIDKAVSLYMPFQKSESSPFTIELTLQAKLGKADSQARQCEKLQDPKKRFKPIHPAFYLALKDNHLKVKVTHDFNDKVHIVFIAGEKFRPQAESFFSTLKKFGFDTVSDNGFDFNFQFNSDKNVSQIINRYIQHGGYFFQTILQDSNLKARFSNEAKAWDLIDLFLDLASEKNNIPKFSDFEEVDIEAQFDLYSQEEEYITLKKNWVYQKIEDFFEESIVIFSNLTDKELKQQVKVNSLLMEKMMPNIEVSLCVAGLCDLRGKLEGVDLLKLFEFLILFPSREHPEAVEKYLSKWIERSK